MTKRQRMTLDDGSYVERYHSEVLDCDIYIFSDSLKKNRFEWLELFPNDVIYLVCELKLIREKKCEDEMIRNLHELKKNHMNRIIEDGR